MNVLVFISHYLPGFKSGGPVKTLKNMVDNLDYNFHIVTLNHDIDGEIYNIESNTWLNIFGSKTYYVDPKNVNRSFFKNIINEVAPDFIYLNSFFDSVFSSKFMWLNYRGKLFDKNKVVVAPRGEFGDNALKIKKIKKNIYLNLINTIGLYSETRLQASNLMEAKDIEKKLKCKEIKIASDIPTQVSFKRAHFQNNQFKIIHLARISEIKNLLFCLQVLKFCRKELVFDIYGPIEDEDYWKSCLHEIKNMPNNIKVNYLGELDPENIQETFSKYSLLFLPSLGENFCHVIAESFSYGVPVLISDKTPWRNLTEANLGWDLSLDNIEYFVNIIDNFHETQIANISTLDIYYNYLKYFQFDKILESNYQIFIQS